MQAQQAESREAVIRAEQLAAALPEGRERAATREQLEEALVRIKEMTKQGRRFLRIASYARFAHEVSATIGRLQQQCQHASWAEQVSGVVSVAMADGTASLRAVRRARNARERGVKLQTASRQFAVCLAAAQTASESADYDSAFLLETPAGRMDLATVVASCEEGQTVLAKLAGKGSSITALAVGSKARRARIR